MTRWLGSLVVAASLIAVAWAGVPDEAKVQGIWEGTWKDAGTEGKAEAKVYAEGGGQFRMAVVRTLDEGKTDKAVLAGKTQGAEVAFAGKVADTEWSAAWKEGHVAGKFGAAGTFAVERVERKFPPMGAKPPEGAVVLFDGKDLDQWNGPKNGPAKWKILGDGAAEVQGGSITTKKPFGSCKLHVEFRCSFKPEARSQGRGNSGLFLPNGDEIQVLDSFGNETYSGGGCGGLYKYKDPDTDVILPPLEWQTYDVEFTAPKVAREKVTEKGKAVEKDKVVAKGRVTVLQNGIKIHDDAELQHTGAAGPIQLQDHGNPVQYRNIWIVPSDAK